MTRRRWIQIDGELVEVSQDYTPEKPDSAKTRGILWNDREYQDMGDPRFSSRAQHREYMKTHGVTTTDDFKGEWKAREAQRVKAAQGYDPTRKEDLVRAINQLNSRR